MFFRAKFPMCFILKFTIFPYQNIPVPSRVFDQKYFVGTLLKQLLDTYATVVGPQKNMWYIRRCDLRIWSQKIFFIKWIEECAEEMAVFFGASIVFGSGWKKKSLCFIEPSYWPEDKSPMLNGKSRACKQGLVIQRSSEEPVYILFQGGFPDSRELFYRGTRHKMLYNNNALIRQAVV